MAYLKPGTYPYTLGRGKLLVRKDSEDTWHDILHAKDIKINITADSLEHENFRRSVKVVDKEIVTKIKASGSFMVDVPIVENLALFLYGDASASTQTSGTWTAEAFTVDTPDRWQDLGKRNITVTSITDDAGTPVALVEGTDYYIDTLRGLFLPLSTSTLIGVAADGFKITGTYAENTKQVIGVGETIQKRHVWFQGDPACGKYQDIKGYCIMKPNGDMGFIGDEWQGVTIDLLFQAHASYDSPTGVVYEDLGTVAD